MKNIHIQKVLYYIENNIGESLSTEHLAHIAGYSKYHFCRIFKVYVGESVMGYITRLRLEKSSIKIVQESSTIDVALDVGYLTPNGFNKGFKKYFGVNPTEYKKIRNDFLQRFEGKLMQTPKVVELCDRSVVFTREVGEYEKSSTLAWERLSKQLNTLEKPFKKDGVDIVLDVRDAELLGICYDDPKVTKEEDIRYDAAISWDDKKIDTLKKYGLDTKKIEGGKYVMTTHYGDVKNSIQSWYALYRWCSESGYKFRDAPPFEKYINLLQTQKQPDKQITEIYIPVE